MSEYLPFIVIGLVTGSVYGFAACGLVVTYKASGIFNFAHGSIAALAVFVFDFLWVREGVVWPVSAAIAFALTGPGIGVLLEVFTRRLGSVSEALRVGATIGIVVLVIAIGDIWYGPDAQPVPAFLPTATFRVLGAYVSYGQVIIALAGLLATMALFCFFRFARLGAAMRGVVDDPTLMSLTGESPAKVRRWAWIIGASFASLAGILLASSASLNAIALTELVIQAFGAAAIGYFANLPLTYVGGLVVGVAGAIATKISATVPGLVGFPLALPFVILIVVLLGTPRARLATQKYTVVKELIQPWYAPARARLAFGVLVTALAGLVPLIAGTRLALASSALIAVILLLSLGLLVRTSGQVSLCQYGFAAIGAAAMAHLTTGLGVPWLPALVIAGLIAVPVGAVVAIPAIRLSGIFLGLATLGFGIFLEQMMYGFGVMFGNNGIPTPRPSFSVGPLNLATDNGFYYVLLACAVLAAVSVALIQRSRLGRILRAMRDSPLALETHGANVSVARVLVFCISAFMAAIAGALTASLLRFAVSTDYDFFSSLTVMLLVVIIPLGDPWYAVIGALGLAVVPSYISGTHGTDYLNILFGVLAVAAPLTLARHPRPPAFVLRLADGVNRALGGSSGGMTPGAGDLRTPRRVRVVRAVMRSDRAQASGDGAVGESHTALEVSDLKVVYGPTVAVDSLSFKAPLGEITGLIGPNGAGKSTTFSAISGLVPTVEGSIALFGEPIDGLTPSGRARHGVGRTFQRVDLWSSLTVRENIEVGAEAAMAGGNPYRQIVPRHGDDRRIRRAATDAIEAVGAGAFADRKIEELSTGQRRLVELARVVAGGFRMLLLDEPSAGLDELETRRFGDVLERLVAGGRIGILLVEHDIELVRRVCRNVIVMDFGRKVFSGDADSMVRSMVVREAYLGVAAAVGPP